MRALLTHGLRSRVAARMALLFALCAGVPLAGLAVLTVTEMTKVLEERARQRLRYEARMVAQEALGKLDLLARSLELAGRALDEPAASDANRRRLVDALFAAPPRAMAVVSESGTVVPLTGEIARPTITPAQDRHLEDWGRLIVASPTQPSLLYLVVRVPSRTGRGLAVASLDEAQLFGLSDEDGLPPDSSVCVAAGSGRVRCSTGAPEGVAEQALAQGDQADLTLASGDEPFFVRTWPMTLKAQYDAAPWTVVLIRPQAIVRAPIAGFERDFWLVVLFAGLIAAWLSVTQVRRQLRPLEALTVATSQLAEGRFDTRVEVHSNDEFRTLGNAFNDLSTELQRQFAELEAFNLGTLSALARAIDAKSSWTAGHSERVTAVAVALGLEVGLTTREVDELRRGGLVHDIGKLATPPHILDKLGRLTAEEARIMRLHPTQGVHILEPIRAFAPLLPIVGQHHERWDGAGYPAGLAGESISRTARVLSVADVYDALRSERPYRRGVPHERVVVMITADTGVRFDPAIVEVFVRLAPTLKQVWADADQQASSRDRGLTFEERVAQGA